MSEGYDRDLNAAEELFLVRHKQVCKGCQQYEKESVSSLTALRAVRLEAQVTDNFDVRVRRRIKVGLGRDNIRYWMPAISGAGLACIALFATMRVVTTPSTQDPQKAIGSASRNTIGTYGHRLVLPNTSKPSDDHKRSVANTRLSRVQ